MKKINLKISGMTCSACSKGLEKYLSKQKGIKSVSVNLILSLASIEYENVTIKDLEKYIAAAGFKSMGEFKSITDSEVTNYEKFLLIFLGIIIIFLMYICFAPVLQLPDIPFLNHTNPRTLATTMFAITIVFLIYGKDILLSGIKNLWHKMPNMDTLVTFSAVFSFLYSLYSYIEILLGNVSFIHNLYFESTCMIIYFIKLGRYIETFSKDKTKDALKELVQITPEYANLKKDSEVVKVSIDEVVEDAILVSKSGEKIAVDGIVTNGRSYVDESFITGESKPVLKEVGSKVIAGSILYDGYLEYSAKQIGKSSTISQIIEIVINATSTKSKTEYIADKISGYFVPIVMLIGLITFIIHLLLGFSFSSSLTYLVTVLVVACPCALGLAVPLVNVVANGLCAKKGIFLKHGTVLEKAKDIDTIVFDKTGTLTYGKLNVYKLFNYSNMPEEKLLNLIANIESLSNHPVATAFKIKEKIPVECFKSIPGKGIKGVVDKKTYYLGNQKMLEDLKIKETYKKDYDSLISDNATIIYVVSNNSVIALVGLRDTIRKDISHKIKQFQDSGIDVIMLTGDNENAANVVANEVGIKRVLSSVLPQDKEKIITDIIANNRKVIMVGDGINDAPALVKATVGVSISDGTDIAADSADVILLNNDIANIFDLLIISKKSYRVIKQNLFWAFTYNICMIPIAAGVFGVFNLTMNPMFASIAMTISSLTVVINSYMFGVRNK